jgi:SAM-dependent methyltransferase
MWDQRYATDAYVYGTAPSAFLQRSADLLRPGEEALAVADGEGRNSVFMAQKGLQVTAMDSSAVGLEKARRLADAKGVYVDFRLGDLKTWEWTSAKYDVVAAIFIQFANPAFRAEIFDGIERTLKPGGLLLLHGYTPSQIELGTGGPPIAENLYTKDLLAERFGDWDIIRLGEYETELREGAGHSGPSALIDLIARRPILV